MVSLNENIDYDGKSLMSFTNYHLEPDYATTKTYSHYALEISYIKSGSGKYLVDNRIYEIHEGDIFIFNNIEPHVICSINPNTEFINSVIEFDPRFIWYTESNLFDSCYLRIFFNRNESFQNRLKFNEPSAAKISKLFLEIENEFKTKQPQYQFMVKAKLLCILVELTRHYGYSEKVCGNIFKQRKDLFLIDNIIDYISKNLSNPITLKDLAEIVHLNPSYFSTFFRKYIGIPPSEYIAKQRVIRTIEYLENSNKTMLEIAGLCGFNSTANFNKTFKKYTGKIPSDFR